jgi:hypothetical protein
MGFLSIEEEVPCAVRDSGGRCKNMGKLRGTVLALVGIFVGTYAVLSGRNTGASPPKISADASVRMPTPSEQFPVEDAGAPPATSRPSEPIAAIPPRVLDVADAAPRVPMGQYPPSFGLPPDRVQLSREIQVQLKRVGCYHGPIDGVWSASVRRSMKTFTDRVNATLPVEQPDIILLAMLRSHQDSGCGVPCPPGQGVAVDRRCLPNVLLARIGEKQAPASSTVAATASPPVDEKLPVGQPLSKEERMSLAGPSLPPATSDAPAKTGRRYASPPAGVSPSGRFPRWAARAFESW